jgi:hypothetical protein
MKKLLAAAVGFLALLGVMLAVPAFSSPSSPSSTGKVPRQIRQLNAKVRALQARVSQLEKSVGGIKACTSTVQPLTRFNGYVWSDGVNQYLTTAIDVPETGEAVGAYFVLADASCVTGGSSHQYSLVKPSRALDRASRGERLQGLGQARATRASARSSARMASNRLTYRQR